MNRLFRDADFNAENPGLKERLWEKVQIKIAEQERHISTPVSDERELTEDELLGMAAAGDGCMVGKSTKEF
ncbi:MAG: hypothetical protein IKN12_08985 [Selenomonadaceae bacterium]|nr:hypothetical protein [Selenomonadaceae bacterium]